MLRHQGVRQQFRTDSACASTTAWILLKDPCTPRQQHRQICCSATAHLLKVFRQDDVAVLPHCMHARLHGSGIHKWHHTGSSSGAQWASLHTLPDK
jgi:hypothetical protein